MAATKREQGNRYGRLVVTSLHTPGRTNVHAMWSCVCDCGAEVVVRSNSLRTGRTKSCGCLVPELSASANTKHGHTKHPLYNSWYKMLDRCNNSKSVDYESYGARGIHVCKRWHDFVAFISDVSPRPAGHQLDREDNGLGYTPENCRWVTPKVNSNNRRNNFLVSFNGVTLTLAQWGDKLNVRPGTIRARIKAGWALKDALSSKVKGK